jgi:hypothetical protein
MKRLASILFITISFIFSSCEKNGQEGSNILLADFDFEDKSDRYILINKSINPNGSSLQLRWEVLNEDISFKDSINPHFILPYRTQDSVADVRLTVNNGIDTASVTKILSIPKTTWYRVYGMGTNIGTSRSNNVSYSWYIDQTTTGKYWYENCGPACATMALKWVFPNFIYTTEDARNTYLSGGGWWYTNNIINYLKLHNAEVRTISFGNNKSQNLVSELDKGRIAILCLDIYYVRTETKGVKWPVDKAYEIDIPNSGHFIVVKGYKRVGSELLFEVYDPASLETYDNTRYTGLDRLYRSTDIMKASNVWWQNAIIIHPKTSYPATSLQKSNDELFDQMSIPNQKGW